MANLTQQEFVQAVDLLVEDLGLHRLRDRLVRLNALVTRRKLSSSQQLADQLYMLTGGLRRQIPATLAFQSIWTERVNEKLGEEGEKALEEDADKINACLGEKDKILPEKESELDTALRQYSHRLASSVGFERARIDMLLKAVPDVAIKLRELPVNVEAPPSTGSSAPSADDSASGD
jgi:hypothetical protein